MPRETSPLRHRDTRGPVDRRVRPTPMLSRFTLRSGKRHSVRRGGDARPAYVDTHGAFLFAVVSSIAALNILDAFFTVLFLSHGGLELNPIVSFALDQGIWWFIGVKSLGIGICLVFLTMTKDFLFSRIGLAVVWLGYATLLGWHGHLYTQLPSLSM